MRLLVLGGTGPTGKELVKQALDSGHHVNALVRSPEKLLMSHENLKMSIGSVFEADDLLGAMTGCDAVLSALGGKPGVFTACDVYTKSFDAILEVMKELKVKRFIACTAWGTKDDPDLPYIWRWVLKPSALRNVVADMELFEDRLAEQAGQHINWTVVKPPRLLDKPLSGVPVAAEEGQLVHGVKNQISRADVAHFMLSCLDTSDWDRKLVAIAGGVASEGAEPKEEGTEGGKAS